MTKPFDIYGVGNALLDESFPARPEELLALNVPRSGMTLLTEQQQLNTAQLLARKRNAARGPGGATANSCAVAAALGSRVGFAARLGDDEYGRAWRNGFNNHNAQFRGTLKNKKPGTGQCFVFITPDAERSMATWLGASALFNQHDFNPNDPKNTRILLIEGYLFMTPHGRDAAMFAADAARNSHALVALTVGDVSCLNASEGALAAFAQNVDILFANDREARALFNAPSHSDALTHAASFGPLCIITHGGNGAAAVSPSLPTVSSPAFTPKQVVDLTGAGDAFAGGFLAALAKLPQLNSFSHNNAPHPDRTPHPNHSPHPDHSPHLGYAEHLAHALHLANACGSIAVEQIGGRPEAPFAQRALALTKSRLTNDAKIPQ